MKDRELPFFLVIEFRKIESLKNQEPVVYCLTHNYIHVGYFLALKG